MKRTLILAALVASSSAFANDIDPFGFDQQVFAGSKTRAEVLSELRDAIQLGKMKFGATYPAGMKLDAPAKPRAQVKAELAAAIARGEVNYGEVGGPVATNTEAQGFETVVLAR